MRSGDHLIMPYHILKESPKRKQFTYFFSLRQCTVDKEGYVEDVGIQIKEKRKVNIRNHHPISSVPRISTQDKTLHNKIYDLEFE